MKHLWIVISACLLWAAIPDSAAQTKGSATKKTSPARKTAKTVPKTPAARKKAGSQKTTTARRRPRTRRSTWRATQQKPTPERLTEIQRALAEKGFFEGEPNGRWDDRSIDALKRFQQANQLKPDGKLSALSLIALGLGPKHPPPGEISRPTDSPSSAEQSADRVSAPKD